MHGFDSIDRNPSPADRRRFGLILLGAFAVLALLALLAGHERTAAILSGVGVGFALLSPLPGVGRLLYVGWMGLGIGLGMVTGPIIMGVIYVGLIWPVGLVSRAVRRDPLARAIDPEAETYWEDHPPPPDPARYLKPY